MSVGVWEMERVQCESMREMQRDQKSFELALSLRIVSGAFRVCQSSRIVHLRRFSRHLFHVSLPISVLSF
jgi:hypothetical protein